MRRDIAFEAEGATLRGWLYLPEGARDPVPAVKEMYLDRFADAFAEAGLGVLLPRPTPTSGLPRPAGPGPPAGGTR